jgi:hypothetical protein
LEDGHVTEGRDEPSAAVVAAMEIIKGLSGDNRAFPPDQLIRLFHEGELTSRDLLEGFAKLLYGKPNPGPMGCPGGAREGRAPPIALSGHANHPDGVTGKQTTPGNVALWLSEQTTTPEASSGRSPGSQPEPGEVRYPSGLRYRWPHGECRVGAHRTTGLRTETAPTTR